MDIPKPGPAHVAENFRKIAEAAEKVGVSMSAIKKQRENRPSPKAAPVKRDNSLPNNAFREHEGLRKLQQQMNNQPGVEEYRGRH